MILTINEHNVFYSLFNEVATWQFDTSSLNKSDKIIIKRIKVVNNDKMGKLLRVLLQQNILKEFLIEKVYFNEEISIYYDKPIAPDTSLEHKMVTFYWTVANISNRTNIRNWHELLNARNIHQLADSSLEIKDKVIRREEPG